MPVPSENAFKVAAEAEGANDEVGTPLLSELELVDEDPVVADSGGPMGNRLTLRGKDEETFCFTVECGTNCGTVPVFPLPPAPLVVAGSDEPGGFLEEGREDGGHGCCCCGA